MGSRIEPAGGLHAGSTGNHAVLKQSCTALLCCGALLTLSGPMSLRAEVVEWTGAHSADWFDAANWSGNRLPVEGDAVAVDAASAQDILLSRSTPSLASFTISGRTLTFTNWSTTLRASNVAILGGGKLTHAVCDTRVAASNTNRVSIACVNCLIAEDGIIDADRKGYPAGRGPGAGVGFATYGGGAGHGGRGGRTYYVGATNGLPCDSVSAPVQPGSGGGAVQEYSGNGGGAVRIEARGIVTINGTISADGGSAPADVYNAAGGAGGAVFITCRAFGGSDGLLRANGGSSGVYAGHYYHGGAGGGGRIAVDSTGVAGRPSVRFATSPGKGMYTAGEGVRGPGNLCWRQFDAEMGTVWLRDTALLSEGLTDGLFTDVSLTVGGVKNWAIDHLTVRNCSVTFAESGFHLTVSNSLIIGAGGVLGIGAYSTDSRAAGFGLHCGELMLIEGGALHVYAGPTHGTGFSEGAVVDVAGDVTIGSGSWIYPYSHQQDGGSVRLSMRDLTIDKRGGINADHNGYAFGHGPGTGSTYETYGGGGGHGGRGGRAYFPRSAGGRPYGSPAEPCQPGSGGGFAGAGATNDTTAHSANGGGLVHVEARGAVTVRGTITANGADANPDTSPGGGGAGGGIIIKCKRFGGPDGLLRANGGRSGQWQGAVYSGGGGGGRIAVLYETAGEPVRFATSPGVGIAQNAANPWDSWWAHAAQMGTVYLPDTRFLSEILAEEIFTDVRLFLGDTRRWEVADLAVRNCSVTFAQSGFHLSVAGNLVVGTNAYLGLGDRSQESPAEPCVLECGRNLFVTKGGELHVYSGKTNGTACDYGALVDVRHDVVVREGSWIYPYAHETDGGAVLLRLKNLMITGTNAGINATGRGFAPQRGRGAGQTNTIYAYGGGGGYGGQGGLGYVNTPGGRAYGSATRPVDAGSGGGHPSGGSGGGVVRVECRGTVGLDGTIAANGGQATEMYGSYGGGGAGGAIFIRCETFKGGVSGMLNASGGNGAPSDSNGAGGGGRIYVSRATHRYDGSAIAEPGAHGYTNTPTAMAEAGTVVWQDLPPIGSIITSQ